MDIQAFQQTVQHAGLASIWVAFLAGLLFSFNPVAIAAIPVALAYVTRSRERRQAILFGAMFILGMIAIHVLLGVVAGFGGREVQMLLGRYWGLVLGPVLIMLGLLWPGWLRMPLPSLSYRAERATSMWGAFALGIPFSIAVCPACTPILVVMLGVVAGIGSPWFGAALLLAFALGRAIPIALGAGAMGWLEHLKPLTKYHRAFEIVGGLVLIVVGLYMLNAYFIVIPTLAL